MIRAFIFLVGFGSAVAGGISTLAYLNLFVNGVDLKGYLLFILKRPECYLLPIGLLIVASSIYTPDGKKSSN
ncbi:MULTISPECIES: hypothetical protein [Sutcliffiella]|uniref:hypothetical protein n=1 Tax=Sutcliffiella TaxID=2837511 RepID=UPI000A42E9D5|nr:MULTISPECIES: hypothetical protein [Sutcliffiella]WBL17514.1 hypothetical protein O1A01_06340 [Sutcliffiella sp. NC1]